MDAGVVTDVVPPVLVRRGHGGRQPDGVHPEPGQVIEPLDDAAQVAVPVVVAVPPGPYVQLVDDGTVPPAAPVRVLGHLLSSSGSPCDRRQPTLACSRA